MVVLVDFGFVYMGCYFLNVQQSNQLVDLVAYAGYKFVGYAVSSKCLFICLCSPQSDTHNHSRIPQHWHDCVGHPVPLLLRV